MIKQIRLYTLLIAIFTISVLNAAIPRTIAYQGLLTDPTGNPVADGKQNVVFSLYDATTAVTALWSEELTDVTTSKGVFSVLLGSKTPLSIPFDKQYWIEIKVNSKVVSPRVQLSVSAYAMRADTADIAKNVVVTALNGKADVVHRHSVLFREGKSDTIVTIDSTGKVGVGTKVPLTKVHLCDTSSKSPGLTIENTNSGSRGPGIIFKKSGTTLGLLSTDGLIRGDDSSNIGIFAETGKKINFYAGGSAKEKFQIMHDGNVRVNNTLSIDSGCSHLNNTVEIIPAPAGGTCKILTSHWATPGDLVIGTHAHQSNQLYLSKNGNVGIGTSIPQGALHLKSSKWYGSFRISPTIDDGECSMGFYRDADGVDSLNAWCMGRNVWGVGNNTFALGNNGPILIVTKSGNIGIGTNSPNCKLDVMGNISLNSSIMQNWHANYSILDLRGYGCVYGSPNGGGYAAGTSYGQVGLIQNTTYDGTNSRAIGTGSASSIFLTQGHIEIANAASVSAGEVQTFVSRLHITDAGNVGIGTNTPSYKLDVVGDIHATNFPSSSDRRYKTEITLLDSSLNKISQLQGVNYKWDTKKYPEKQFSEDKQIGLIAQDVEKVIPEVVHTDNDGYKSLSYDKLTAVLIEAVKTLKAENEALQKRVEVLERKAQGSAN